MKQKGWKCCTNHKDCTVCKQTNICVDFICKRTNIYQINLDSCCHCTWYPSWCVWTDSEVRVVSHSFQWQEKLKKFGDHLVPWLPAVQIKCSHHQVAVRQVCSDWFQISSLSTLNQRKWEHQQQPAAAARKLKLCSINTRMESKNMSFLWVKDHSEWWLLPIFLFHPHPTLILD